MMAHEIKTASDLRMFVESAGHCPHFFDTATMRFFGDRMGNYGLRDAGTMWELYRRKPVKHGLQSSAYFDKLTFQRCYPVAA